MKNLVKRISLCFLILSCILYSCTNEETPTLTTTEVTSIKMTSATSGGNIIFDGGAIVSERGVCWSTNIFPTFSDYKTSDGAGEGSFSSNISNLTAETKYYLKAYATNTVGTGYGNEISFTTKQLIAFNPILTYGIISDVDGNNYKTIQIGTQLWMAENLKTTKYSDGSLIPIVTDSATWCNLTTPGYCWYNNDADTYKPSYGALYNWYVVSATTNGEKNICPAGWNVPSQDEWLTLITFLGGNSVASGKLREIGTAHWTSPNLGATNESGFTALPAGLRGKGFAGLDTHTDYWTATPYNDKFWSHLLKYDSERIDYAGREPWLGFSIRCLKD